jgi:Uma2 family endonuclease
MTVDEFLRWEDGTDTRYELVYGAVVAMAPPARHGILVARLAGVFDAALRGRRPCAAESAAGVARPDPADLCFVADVAVSCDPGESNEQLIPNPILIVEILRRDGERWITEIVQGTQATLSLASVPLTVAMAELYEGIPLPERAGRTIAG